MGTIEVAEVFTKVAKPADHKALPLPRGSSREELRIALAEHPHTVELLNMELDTLGEDWLVALQEELTKPYFLSVSIVWVWWRISPKGMMGFRRVGIPADEVVERVRHRRTSTEEGLSAE
jgi:hypothetical protein